MALPWSKFFWSDYASDPALKLCSLAAQGLWMRMLCIAAEHEPVGYVAVNGEGLDVEGIAALCGARIEQVEECLAELRRRGVYSVDRRGWIYSRRLINDAKKSRKASESGKLGGNPTLRKQTGNSGALKGEDKGGDKLVPKPQKPEARVHKKKDFVEKSEHPLPADWQPEPFGDGSKSKAIVDGWPNDHLALQVEKFRAYHTGHGTKWRDWQKAWATWVLNAGPYVARVPRHPAPSGSDDATRNYLIDEIRQEREWADRQKQAAGR